MWETKTKNKNQKQKQNEVNLCKETCEPEKQYESWDNNNNNNNLIENVCVDVSGW